MKSSLILFMTLRTSVSRLLNLAVTVSVMRGPHRGVRVTHGSKQASLFFNTSLSPALLPGVVRRRGALGGHVFMAMMTEKATACNRVLRFTPKCFSHPLFSLSISSLNLFPQPPTKQGPELRCSGIPALLSSGIKASHLERGWGNRRKKKKKHTQHPTLTPWVLSTEKTSPFWPLANQHLLAISPKPELHVPEGDS